MSLKGALSHSFWYEKSFTPRKRYAKNVMLKINSLIKVGYLFMPPCYGHMTNCFLLLDQVRFDLNSVLVLRALNKYI